MGLFDKGIKKTKEGFFQRLSRSIVGKSRVDDEVLDAIEEALVASDMGVDTTLKIVDSLEERVERDKYMSFDELLDMLRDEIGKLLEVDEAEAPEEPFDLGKSPLVIMVVGVNGVGKTTTIGKLAARYKAMGKKVMIGAADTFRAAAVDQLVIDLMNELTKIRNVMRKVIPDAPHEVLLVLDASTGQNAYQQAKEFSRATDITSLAVTKLDGTAKGGVVIGIVDQLKVPVKFIGIGEGIDDLKVFDKKEFVNSLFSREDIEK